MTPRVDDMNSRKRRTFRISPETVSLLEHIDGKRTAGELRRLMLAEFAASPESTDKTLTSLRASRIITEVQDISILCPDDSERYARQINYFAEFFEDEADGLRAQRRISSSRVVIFGCGAVGGDIALELAMPRGIPHIVGGGYNLHLSLIGQTVIPGETACVKCFERQLERENEIDPTRVKKLQVPNRKVGSLGPLCALNASMPTLSSSMAAGLLT